ncbi:MAG: NlpC/P60 family protein [Pseudoflavonifractor sp.]|nr:NlpC/P60 family protein [Pseudoflavonifractor sp.]
MRRNRDETAARRRAAVFLLIVGLLLSPILYQRAVRVPPEVEPLLRETLTGERDSDRRALVRTACGLVGRVSYFWGGKSRATGWDRAWGCPRRVMAEGSDSTGHFRRYGLDCSGLVSWAAAAALDDAEAYAAIGEGVRAQYAACQPTQLPRPGDLAFFPNLSHVGIVLGRDGGGTLWVVHCSASLGGVVVTPAAVGFTLFGTPGCLNREKSGR